MFSGRTVFTVFSGLNTIATALPKTAIAAYSGNYSRLFKTLLLLYSRSPVDSLFSCSIVAVMAVSQLRRLVQDETQVQQGPICEAYWFSSPDPVTSVAFHLFLV
jgi:hypothetical protein